MKVPFLDLRAGVQELEGEIADAVTRVMRSGTYIGGAEVDLFELEFARFCEADHCVAVSNGLDALHLALRSVGVGPGDEVIVPSNTFIATWLAVTMCGAIPRPVEPRADTYNLDPEKIIESIGPRTRAIIPVHLYGQAADLDPVLEIARKLGLFVVEDAAQAHGARYKGRRIGAHGDIVAWSFYPGKNLGALGDGGAITTKCAKLAEKIRLLRNYGSSTRYVHDEIGFNARLDPIQAAVLRAKLSRLEAWNLSRKAVAAYYLAHLPGAPLILPAVAAFADPVWHLFVIRHPQRLKLQEALAERGVETLIHYPRPPHVQGAYKDHVFGAQPIAESLAEGILSLPIGPHMSLEMAEYVSRNVSEFVVGLKLDSLQGASLT